MIRKNGTPLAVLFLALVAGPAFLVAQQSPEPRTLGRFTIEVEAPRLPVEAQGETGTCWSYATLSFFESEAARLTGKLHDLSEMWVVRQAILEKSRRYVMLGGKAQFGEGGLSHDVTFLMERYGMLPRDAYAGDIAGQDVRNHSELFRLLQGVLEVLTDKKKGTASGPWEQAILGIVDAYLGAPPATVEVGGRKLDPREYMKQVLKLDPAQYVEVMSFGYSPFGERAELLVPDNWLRYQDYLNLPLDTFMEGLDHALANGFTAAVDMDVSERGFKARDGMATLPDAQEEKGAVTQELRDRLFRSGETSDDHLMHVVGIARDKAGRKFYLTKNSWGPVGSFGGYLLISENFMRAKALAYMVHKNGLPKSAAGSGL